MKKKITIEIGFLEAVLIEKALELYTRTGLLQFNRLTICDSLQSKIWKDKLSETFEEKTDALKAIFNYSRNSNPGILNKTDVQDDVRIACHMFQQFRHERYKDRIASGEQIESYHTVDEYPADMCDIAGIRPPDCTITITNVSEE